jgi:anti-anti-sigma factor
MHVYEMPRCKVHNGCKQEKKVDIKTVHEDGVLIVSISGKVDGMASAHLEEFLTALLDKGENRIILDLKDVYYISSGGLRVVLMVTKRLYGQGKIILVRLQSEVREVFEMTGFDTIVPICEDLKIAKLEMESV